MRIYQTSFENLRVIHEHTVIDSERYELDLLFYNIAHLDCGVLREKITCEF
jgi:hypothetical protein